MRKELYSSLDKLNESLIEKLKKLEGGTLYFEDSQRDQVVLVLQLSPLQTQINYPSTEGYSLKTLIKDSKGCSKNHLRETFKAF